MTELTPEMLKDNAPWLSHDGEAIVELEAYAAAWEAELARLRELVKKRRNVLDGILEFHGILKNWSEAYPTDVFPEPPPDLDGETFDACSAAMGRHVTKYLLEDLNSLVMEPLAALEQSAAEGSDE